MLLLSHFASNASRGISPSSGETFSLVVCNRGSPSAARHFMPAQWTISNFIFESHRTQSASLPVLSVWVKTHFNKIMVHADGKPCSS